MKNRLLIGAVALAVGLLAAVPPAVAQGVIIDQDGVRIVPPGYDRAPQGYDRAPPPRAYQDGGRYGSYAEIGPRQARRIARSVGLVETYDVHRRGPMWIVTGGDRRGRDLRVVISARSGEVVNVDRRG